MIIKTVPLPEGATVQKLLPRNDNSLPSISFRTVQSKSSLHYKDFFMRKEKLKLQAINISSFVTVADKEKETLLGGQIDAFSRGWTYCRKVTCTFDKCTGPIEKRDASDHPVFC